MQLRTFVFCALGVELHHVDEQRLSLKGVASRLFIRDPFTQRLLDRLTKYR
ncbi:hypothetical protein D3C75_1145700 [compost metagenome]